MIDYYFFNGIISSINSPDLIIERFLSREKTLSTGKKVKGCITIKHSLHPDGRIIYSLEVMDTKKALEQTRAKGQRQK